MKYASSSRNSKELLISLESLNGGSLHEGIHVSVDELYKGINHVFKIDSSNSTRSLALMICADKKKTGTCSKAKVIDQGTLNNILGATATKTKQDYVFYFQHLIITKNSLQAYRSDLFTDHFKKTLGQYLAKSDVSQKDLQEALKTTQTIRSNPVDINEGKITLSLPYNDPRCMDTLSH